MYENWIFAIVMDDSDNNASYAYFKQNMQEWYNLKSVFFLSMYKENITYCFSVSQVI